MKKTASKRDLTFDIARALCILWIIGVWHILDYIDYSETFKQNVSFVTRCVLACFTLISGFFCGKKTISPMAFYRNRFKRFYVLLFIACITMVLMNKMIGGWALVFTMTGLSNFMRPQAMTLWYMAMLLFFYILTPLLTNKKGMLRSIKRPYNILLRGFVIYLILRIMNYHEMADSRTCFYFIFFVIGIATSQNMYLELLKHRIMILAFALFSTILCLYINGPADILPFLGTIIIIIASSFFKDICNLQTQRLFTIIAYASLCAYLFHRPIYWLFKNVLSNANGFIELYYVPLMVIVTLIISWIIQYSYDKIVHYLEASFKKQNITK